MEKVKKGLKGRPEEEEERRKEQRKEGRSN